jgi:hypothetical protein
MGTNQNDSTVNTYASGSVTSTGSSYGCLSGYAASSSKTKYCYWNKEASKITSGYGAWNTSATFTADSGVTIALLKKSTSFSAWNFNTIWTIRTDSTYPGLRGVDNAPFAYADSFSTTRVFKLSNLLANDCDIETGNKNLVLKVLSATSGTTDSVSSLTFGSSIAVGTKDTVYYRVGETRSAVGDTLWGNVARAILVLSSNTETEQGLITAPEGFALNQNYPNPFNPTTTIRYELPKQAFVTLKVYDLLGKEVATLVQETKTAGSYLASFHAAHLSSGIYFYKLTAGEFTTTKKLVLMK